MNTEERGAIYISKRRLVEVNLFASNVTNVTTFAQHIHKKSRLLGRKFVEKKQFARKRKRKSGRNAGIIEEPLLIRKLERRVFGSEMAKESQTAITALSGNPIKQPPSLCFGPSLRSRFPQCLLLQGEPFVSQIMLLVATSLHAA